MFSQSIFAQLMRMSLLLAVALLAVHHSPKLLDLLAQQAINSGCHQQNPSDPMDHSHHQHHHH
ncbi:hypothetical protein JCM19235_6211 [Vibrio maritimus]|uniref:Uncharacterized protein n=1 Tax=Vibrio maritimus TaxID=990268 RepID=A0A090RSV9_9VIBR|nr:hypothetical protein JCM19235_6211 [Vibrio maritimus]